MTTRSRPKRRSRRLRNDGNQPPGPIVNRLLLRFEAAATGVALAGIVAGCAALRTDLSTPAPAESPASLATAGPPPAVSAPAAPSQAEPKTHTLLKKSFLDLEAGRPVAARASLDSACAHLTDLMGNDMGGLPSAQAAAQVRVVLELYQDLLGPTTPIPPESELAGLLLALPSPVVSHLEDHPFFEDFWIRRLAGTADVPVDYTAEVRRSIRYFQTEGRHVLALWLSRSSRYLPMIHEVFSECHSNHSSAHA